MALHHADSGELLHIGPLGTALRDTHSTTLVRAEHIEVFRLVLPAGAQMPDHKLPRVCKLPCVSTIQCLEGTVEVAIDGHTHQMRPGNLIYLSAGEPHALSAIEDSAVLVTMLTPRE